MKALSKPVFESGKNLRGNRQIQDSYTPHLKGGLRENQAPTILTRSSKKLIVDLGYLKKVRLTFGTSGRFDRAWTYLAIWARVMSGTYPRTHGAVEYMLLAHT